MQRNAGKHHNPRDSRGARGDISHHRETFEGFYEQLKMNKAEVEAVDFARAHRIGQKQIDQQWPRPVVARFNDFKKKLALMEKTDTSKDPASSLIINSLRR